MEYFKKTQTQSLGILACLAFALTLSACQLGSSSEEEESTDSGDNENVTEDSENPAYEILEAEGGLASFSILDFYQDSSDLAQDRMELFFLSFGQASTDNEIDNDDDADQTQNDIPVSREVWNEQKDALAWKTISNPFDDTLSPYNQFRPYREVTTDENSQLILSSSSSNSKNKPLYEAIEGEILEHQLAASYVWDMSVDTDSSLDKEYDLNNDRFDDYETLETYSVLPNSSIWGDNEKFSTGAKLFVGFKRINRNVSSVESTWDSSAFTFNNVRLSVQSEALSDIPNRYLQSGTARLSFPYTLELVDSHEVFIDFDPASSTAYLYSSSDQSSDAIASAPYSTDISNKAINIDIQNLTGQLSNAGKTQLELLEALSLTSNFNLAVIGPYASEDTSGEAEYFYLAKAYVTPNETQKKLLTPFFMFNGSAQSDIQEQFEAFREEEHDDFYN